MYWNAALFSFAGEYELALEVLERAINKGYCSYTQIETDPLFEGLKSSEQYADAWTRVRAAGVECHQRFLTETSQR
jgi:hypothetical protein